MAFEEGISGNPNGRPKGSQNRLTKTVKETVLDVFLKLQEPDAAQPDKMSLDKFAEKYPKDFYNIAAKLIPTELSAKVEATVKQVIYESDERYKDTDNTGLLKEQSGL